MAKQKVKMNGLWTVDKDQYPQEIITDANSDSLSTKR